MELVQRMPYSMEAEQSVLGSVLLEPECFSRILEKIKVDDFFLNQNKEIYSAMLDLFNQSKPIDIVSLKEQLTVRGTLEGAGGLEYLKEIAMFVPTTANLNHYIEVMLEKSDLRNMISIAQELSQMGYSGTSEAGQLIDYAEQKLLDISKKRTNHSYSRINEVIASTLERLNKLSKDKNKVTGIPTGFSDLDEMTSGLQNSDLILVAARPAMGKSSFAMNIAEYAALHKNVPVLVFNLEMSKEQIVSRMLCSDALVDSSKLRTGDLDQNDWDKILRSVPNLSKAPVFIDDTPGISVSEIRAKSRNLKLKENIGLIVIDYLQLMQGAAGIESRQQEISNISRNLKIMAKELDIPVIALSQLSRAPEQRQNHRPILSDLRESGAIEQDADIVMFLYRDDYYDEESEEKNVAECIIAKHRNGEVGTIKMCWLGQYTKFTDMEKQYDGV